MGGIKFLKTPVVGHAGCDKGSVLSMRHGKKTLAVRDLPSWSQYHDGLLLPEYVWGANHEWNKTALLFLRE
jgi:hypothetical protein